MRQHVPKSQTRASPQSELRVDKHRRHSRNKVRTGCSGLLPQKVWTAHPGPYFFVIGITSFRDKKYGQSPDTEQSKAVNILAVTYGIRRE